MIKINTKNKIDFKIRYLDIIKKEWQMRKDTKNFIKSAEYDLKTAEFMLNSERYIYVSSFSGKNIKGNSYRSNSKNLS